MDMRHHRGDQACPVDTVGLNIKGLVKFNLPRPGDVMVPALHMEVPSLHEAVARFFERHGDEDGQLSWDTLLPLFLLSSHGISGEGLRSCTPLRRRRKRSRTTRKTRSRGRSWLRADLRRLRGRDQVSGFRGLASLGPFLGAPAGSPGQVKYTGGTGSGAWHPLTPSWVPLVACQCHRSCRYVEVAQLVRYFPQVLLGQG